MLGLRAPIESKNRVSVDQRGSVDNQLVLINLHAGALLRPAHPMLKNKIPRDEKEYIKTVDY
jgi:hypothetical protein